MPQRNVGRVSWRDPQVVRSSRLSGLIADLGAGLLRVAAFERWGPGDERTLSPEEAEHVIRGVPLRRAEFAAGRSCAHRALAELGRDMPSIVASPSGSPRWPSGTAGSIAHTDGYACAVVAAGICGLSIGVDVEAADSVTSDLYPSLFSATEQRQLADWDPTGRSEVATAMFGLKEAFYKAQHPLTSAWLDFDAVEVVINRGFPMVYRVGSDEALDRLVWPVRAAWARHGSLVVSLVVVDHRTDTRGLRAVG